MVASTPAGLGLSAAKKARAKKAASTPAAAKNAGSRLALARKAAQKPAMAQKSVTRKTVAKLPKMPRMMKAALIEAAPKKAGVKKVKFKEAFKLGAKRSAPKKPLRKLAEQKAS